MCQGHKEILRRPTLGARSFFALFEFRAARCTEAPRKSGRTKRQ